MTGSIDQVQLHAFVVHAHGLQLDGDATLTFQIHHVERLLLHFAHLQCARLFNHTIGQGRLSVVDVRNDAEVTNVHSVRSPAPQSSKWSEELREEQKLQIFTPRLYRFRC